MAEKAEAGRTRPTGGPAGESAEEQIEETKSIKE